MTRPFRLIPGGTPESDTSGEETMPEQETGGGVALHEVELPAERDTEVAVEETLTGPPVDQPAEPEPPKVFATVTGRAIAERNPIVPAWARSKQDLQAAARYAAGQAGYRVAYQASRSPVYVGRALRWAPVGAGRMLARLTRWTFDMDTAPARKQALAAGNVAEYERLLARKSENVKSRLPVAGGALVATAGGGAAAWFTLPWWAQLPLWGGVLFGLARAGRPVDKPITSPAVTVTRYERLTAERVREALCAMGISRLNDPKKITFPQQIHRDGPGQLARCNLPQGVEAAKVVSERGKLSSALRLPRDQVWPSVGPDHEGQLDLWVGYQPASKMSPPRWSIAADGARTSVFEPLEFGYDQRNRPIALPLFQRNWLIGGVPGSGKSYFARAICLAAALDPTTEFKIAEYKGTGDFTDFYEAGLCSEYYCGLDDEALDGGRGIVEWGLAEAARRGARIKKFRAQGLAPEGKVTPELAAMPGSGLHPVVIVIDEAHELLPDPEVAANAEKLIRRGRALNLILIFATQIPDANAVPPNITRCTNTAACLAVKGQIENDMILGTGSHKAGITGTNFRPEIDAGWATVVGMREPVTVRAQYPDAKTTKKILARASELRGGRPAWADEKDAPRLDILVDVLQVWPAGRDRAQWQPLAEALAKFRPEAYEDLTGDSLSALLRGMNVTAINVKAGGTVLKGCLRAEVEAAAAARELGRG